MKRPAIAFVLCLIFTAATYAQQGASDAPATKEDVLRYMDAMHTRDTMVNMLSMVSKKMTAMVHAKVSQDPSLPPDAEMRIDKMMGDTMKNFPVDDLLNAMVPVYQKHYTKGDIDAFVAFYSSPAGQKMLKELPAITTESMQASMSIAQKMVANMQQQIQADIDQIHNDASRSPK
jgi:hypothetical protein